MPTKTHTLIQTLSGVSTGYDFTSIPNTYTDLKLVLYARSNTNTAYNMSAIQFNGDTSGSNYYYLTGGQFGNASQLSESDSSIYAVIGRGAAANAPAGFFTSWEVDIFGYKSAYFKTVLSLHSSNVGASGSALNGVTVNNWRSTSAITRLNVFDASNGAYIAGSTASLYGIKAE